MEVSLIQDLKVLYRLVKPRCRGGSHQDRLEHFYSGQAQHYDSFRARLLHGRADLFAALDAPEGGVWVDFGGGTGASIGFWGDLPV